VFSALGLVFGEFKASRKNRSLGPPLHIKFGQHIAHEVLDRLFGQV
jgi:hypothetical protein